jgi:hypothetical protein
MRHHAPNLVNTDIESDPLHGTSSYTKHRAMQSFVPSSATGIMRYPPALVRNKARIPPALPDRLDHHGSHH